MATGTGDIGQIEVNHFGIWAAVFTDLTTRHERIGYFPWIVPIVLAASTIFVVVFTAMWPGMVTNLALRKGARVTNLPLSPVKRFSEGQRC